MQIWYVNDSITTIIDSPFMRDEENIKNEVKEIEEKIEILSSSKLTCDFGITAL